MSTIDESLRFPNGHSITQTKRNAKRLSQEACIPLNEALDRVARSVLGSDEYGIHWAQSIKILQMCQRSKTSYKDDYKSAKTFSEGIIVAFDIKDAIEINDWGPWSYDQALNESMLPAVITWLVQDYSDEEGQCFLTDDELDSAYFDALNYQLFNYEGITPLGTKEKILADLKKYSFFPPVAIWVEGNITSLSQFCSDSFIRM